MGTPCGPPGSVQGTSTAAFRGLLHSTPLHLEPSSWCPYNTLPGFAELPIASIAKVFRETKQMGACSRACEILPGLWLGSADVSHDTVWLREHGSSTIVNAAKDAQPLAEDALTAAGVSRLVHLPLHDDSEPERLEVRGNYALLRADAAAVAEALGPQVPLSPAAAAAIASFDVAEPGALPEPAEAMDPAGGPQAHPVVYVHCAMGRSRSAAVVLMHLVLNRGMSLLAALVLLRARRPVACPNEAFIAALVATEEVTSAAIALTDGSDGSPNYASTVPGDLQLSHYALVRQFDMQMGAPLRVGSTRCIWDAALAIARRLAAAYDSTAPLASLPSTVVPAVWNAPTA